MKSTRFTLNISDGLKAFIMAIGIPVITVIQQVLPDWTQWLTVHTSQSVALIIQATISGIITYLSKNFFTDDTKAAVKTIQKQGAQVVESPKP